MSGADSTGRLDSPSGQSVVHSHRESYLISVRYSTRVAPIHQQRSVNTPDIVAILICWAIVKFIGHNNIALL